MPQLARGEHRGDGVVHARELVILPDYFHQPGLGLREQRLPLRLERGEGWGEVSNRAWQHIRFSSNAARAGTPGFFNSMTTSGKPFDEADKSGRQV
ncbi:MAG: hypothetical protein L0Z50_13065 [Verrucomicrobiales bacterium]|nr:hypothetical protein [Verrucomicrobiales bacterium]